MLKTLTTITIKFDYAHLLKQGITGYLFNYE
jgi:hypothetical protein